MKDQQLSIYFKGTPQGLRQEIKAQAEKLQTLKLQLEQVERQCEHAFGAIKYTPTEHPGYQIKGDPPGTMGVDRQLPQWVPSTTDKLWTRTCVTCGKVETTGRTKKQNVAGVVAGTYGEMDVPDFGNRF